MLTKEFEPRAIKIARSRKGVPCYWQTTRTFDEMKRFTTVLNCEGLTKTPLFEKDETNSSLMPIVEGDFLFKVFYDSIGTGVSVMRITDINKYSNEATIEILKRKESDSNDWIVTPAFTDMPDGIKNLIDNVLKTNNIEVV